RRAPARGGGGPRLRSGPARGGGGGGGTGGFPPEGGEGRWGLSADPRKFSPPRRSPARPIGGGSVRRPVGRSVESDRSRDGASTAFINAMSAHVPDLVVGPSQPPRCAVC